jgi:hypothetical protein
MPILGIYNVAKFMELRRYRAAVWHAASLYNLPSRAVEEAAQPLPKAQRP